VATAPLIDAEDDDIVLSIGTVNFFGLLAMLAWPLVGGWLRLTSETFGMWAGTTIHAVPQAVAAGFAFSSEAGTLATLVKLVRVACLAPMVFLLAILHTRRHAADNGSTSLTIRYARLVPWFVWGFLILSLANTVGLLFVLLFNPMNPLMGRTNEQFTVPVDALCTFLANLLLTMDMAAIGLEVNLRQLIAVGGRHGHGVAPGPHEQLTLVVDPVDHCLASTPAHSKCLHGILDSRRHTPKISARNRHCGFFSEKHCTYHACWEPVSFDAFRAETSKSFAAHLHHGTRRVFSASLVPGIGYRCEV